MSHPPKNLLDFVIEALAKVDAPQPLISPHRGSWSDSHAGLSQAELDFIPYAPAAAALSDWFYAFTPEIPEEFPWLDFSYALMEVTGMVHIQRNYAGKDPTVLIKAQQEVLPLDVTHQLASISIPMIGTDCESLFTPLAQVLRTAKHHRLDFELDSSPMGGSYMRWKQVEEQLAEDTSERLYHLVFALLIEWSLDLGGRAPYDVYHIQWKTGRIYLVCNPNHPAAIPDELLYDVLAETPLPKDIDGSKEPYWILDDLEAEHPEIHKSIEQRALKMTMEEFSLHMDITEILQGTPDLPWQY